MVSEKGKFSLWTASAFVVANMVGTGVFTSLGFQLLTTENFIAIIILWLVGGVIALCGSLVYGEIGATLPGSGGEYHYMNGIYGPFAGFIAGWISLIVGFAGPIALASIAFSSYFEPLMPQVPPKLVAAAVLTVITLMHSFTLKTSGAAQNVLTGLKVLVIIVFIILGFTLPFERQSFAPSVSSFNPSMIFNSGFAVAIIWVYYAYSGWNASAYISGELADARRTLPRSLLISTLVVTVMYILLNVVFLISTPASEMKGEVEIGLISAVRMMGPKAGAVMGGVIAFLLLSSISSMVFIGPRVSEVMGKDHRILGFLAGRTRNGVPLRALVFQYFLALAMILTGTFELVTKYAGILLSLCAVMTVAGIFVLRKRHGRPEGGYRTVGYPVVPVLFMIPILFSVVYLIREDFVKTFITHEQAAMWTTIMSAGTILVGTAVYFANKKFFTK